MVTKAVLSFTFLEPIDYVIHWWWQVDGSVTEMRCMCGNWGGNADFATLNPHFFNVLSASVNSVYSWKLCLSFLIFRLDACLELLIRTGRLPEAAFLARTYLPSQVSRYRLLILGRNVSNKNCTLIQSPFASISILGWWNSGEKISQKSIRKQRNPLLIQQSMKTFSLD